MAPWTPETDRRLLLSIIMVLSPSPPKWEEVVKLMGEGYTTEAVRQHYKKLKKNAGSELSAAPPAAPSAPASARKRKATVSKRANGDEGVGEDDSQSPSKKPKVKTEETPHEED